MPAYLKRVQDEARTSELSVEDPSPTSPGSICTPQILNEVIHVTAVKALIYLAAIHLGPGFQWEAGILDRVEPVWLKPNQRQGDHNNRTCRRERQRVLHLLLDLRPRTDLGSLSRCRRRCQSLGLRAPRSPRL